MVIGAILKERYQITAELGAGAMGVVYRATDSLMGQEVAIKQLPPHFAKNNQYLSRFEREAHLLRELNHPNIVPFIDNFQEGQDHYLVMAYMPGGNLFERIKQGALPIDEARQIAIDLTDALIRAHRLGIIHRDIKPENILFDAQGTPRLADFGVAGVESGEGSRLTGTGMQMGTPYYMSPEAWHGEQQDEQSDIWSLGIVIYEMLTGELPFKGDTSIAVMRAVLQEPVPDIRSLRKEIPEGLYDIIRKALAKDRAQRYQHIRSLGADLQSGRPARPLRRRGILSLQPGYRISNKMIAGALALVVIVIAGIAIVMFSGGGEKDESTSEEIAEQPDDKPTDAEVYAATQAELTVQAFMEVNLTETATLWTATATEDFAATANARLMQTETEIALAQTATAESWTATPTDLPTDTPTATLTPSDTPSYTPSNTPTATATDTSTATDTPTATATSTVTDTPTFTATATLTHTPTHTLTATPTPTMTPTPMPISDENVEEMVELVRLGPGTINMVAISPDESMIAIASSIGIWLYEFPSLELRGLLEGHTTAVWSVDFSPDSSLLASGSEEGRVIIWDVASGVQMMVLEGAREEVLALAFSPDGARIASGGRHSRIPIWDVASGEEITHTNRQLSSTNCLAWSPDGTLLASATSGNIYMWDSASGRNIFDEDAHRDAGSVNSIVFSADGTQLASAGGSRPQEVRLWDTSDGTRLDSLEDLMSKIYSVRFSSDGTLLALGSNDDSDTLHIWDVSNRQEITVFEGLTGRLRGALWTPDEAHLLTWDSYEVLLWDIADGSQRVVHKGSPGVYLNIVFSPDSHLLAIENLLGDNVVNLWDVNIQQNVAILDELETGVYDMIFSPDETHLLIRGRDAVLLQDITDNSPITVLEIDGDDIKRVIFSPDGTLLATRHEDDSIHLWDAGTGQEFAVLEFEKEGEEELENGIASMAFSPDNRLLASGHADGTIRLWDIRTGQELAVLEGHEGTVRIVAFSPDSNRLVAIDRESHYTGNQSLRIVSTVTTRLWDVNTHEEIDELLKIYGDQDEIDDVNRIAFSPDGTLLAFAMRLGTIRIWNVDRDSEVRELEGHVDDVAGVAFSPDGHFLATGSYDGTVRLWGIPGQ